MAIKSVYISNLNRTLQKLHGRVALKPGAQTVGTYMDDTNTPATTTAPPVEDKQTVQQKVDALNAAKTDATSRLAAASDEGQKSAIQEEIAVYDRKLRWYAGRSGASKPKAAKVERPSKARTPKAPKQESAPAQPAASTSPANES